VNLDSITDQKDGHVRLHISALYKVNSIHFRTPFTGLTFTNT
jgi:hypothetical protein